MNQNENEAYEIQVQEEEVELLRQSLPKVKFMGSKHELLVNYQGFWCFSNTLKSILQYQTHFRARDSDIFLASLPKTGTTWLKSLLFSIVNRANVNHQPLIKNSPLLTHNPHELVYHLDLGVYGGNTNLILPRPHQVHQLPSPRLLHTHIPQPSLPESIKTSSCKIVYIARNPLDTCVSQWHWHVKLMSKRVGAHDGDEFQPPSMDDFFEDFCEGRFPYGPYFEHVLGFWKQSLEQPNKVLFLKYEDIKGDDPVFHLKNLAEFVGFPFSPEEESEGVINDIIELCSIDNLKELEVNKTGIMNKIIEKKDFFRKGEVGDWTNYFTPHMVDKINNLMEQKLGGTGLSFQLLST